MDKATPVRNSHTSTADLLTWSDVPPLSNSSATFTPGGASGHHFGSGARSHQPSDGISKVFSGQITTEEAESLNIRAEVYRKQPLCPSRGRGTVCYTLSCYTLSYSEFTMWNSIGKPCSGYKLSNIFSAGGEDGTLESRTDDGSFSSRTSVRIIQQATNGISQISFSTEENISPKKPTTLTEVAKQRELSGNLECESDSKIKKHLSDAKTKELSGNDIFGPPSEVPTRSLAAARSLELKESKDMGEPASRTVRTSVRVSNPAGGQSSILFGDEPVGETTKKIHNQKFAELTGNDIFKGDIPPGSAEKPLSSAKLKEMSGSDIFSDGKIESRDHLGGVRKPPGGESTISLV